MINKNKFRIIGDATDKSDMNSLEVFKQSGIDTFVIYPNEKDHYGAIERCEKAGLNVFIFGGSSVSETNKHYFPYAIGKFPNYIERYERENVDLNDYKVDGLYMIDEPGVYFFNQINELYIPWFNKNYAGKKIWHVNLFPSYATNDLIGINQTGNNGFEEYINRYVDEVLVNVKGQKTIGVDHYPLREKDGVPSLSDEWLHDLAIVGRAAKRANAIYSVCIQNYWGDGLKKVDCTGDIRCQYYTAMAFGASMFEHYSYSTLNKEEFVMLDVNGNPTEVYYSVRDAIREIRTLEKTYLEYDWKGVKSYLPKGVDCKAFEKVAPYLDKEINGIKDVKVSRQTLVSEFEKEGGKKAYLVVNYGLPVVSSSNLVQITFDKPSKVSVYQGGRKDCYDACSDKLTLFLEAGQGALVVVEN